MWFYKLDSKESRARGYRYCCSKILHVVLEYADLALSAINSIPANIRFQETI